MKLLLSSQEQGWGLMLPSAHAPVCSGTKPQCTYTTGKDGIWKAQAHFPHFHWVWWPLTPEHQAKQWNDVYGEIRSTGLCPVVFPGVKPMHKNVSGLELEHSTSQGEYFCKDLYPSREGARTTTYRGKNDPRAVWGVQSPCAGPPQGLNFTQHTQRHKPTETQNQKNPQTHKTTKPCCCQRLGPRASLQSPNCSSLLPFSQHKIIQIMAPEEREGERSQQELPHAVNPPKALISHTEPFPLLGGASCWLLFSAPPTSLSGLL